MSCPVHSLPDWDPTAAENSKDPIALHDAMRGRCPVAYSEPLGWSLLRHADVRRALADPATFSSAVSQHLAVPSGIDPPAHTGYRRIIDPYFAPERMARLEPACRRMAVELLAALPVKDPFEISSALAEPFAVRAQCAFLGWRAEHQAPLRAWIHDNHAAIRRRDRAALAAVAFAFDAHIRAMLEAHRAGRTDLAGPVVGELSNETIDGRSLTDEEIVSILRNWTVGELATISACVGIVAACLADEPALQTRLRAEPHRIPAAIDEILRLRGPLLASRRVLTRAVDIAGRTIEAGERVTLMWAAANRDEHAFEDAQRFRLDRDPSLNLLYGAGIHVCPGAPLARLELRVLFEEMLARFEIAPVRDRPPVHAQYPAAGFASLTLSLRAIERGGS